jgi:nucleotide-binding universal stress UspA family protein
MPTNVLGDSDEADSNGAIVYTQIIVPFDGSRFSARSIPIAHRLAIATSTPLKIVGFGITASHVDDLYIALGAEAERITDIEVDWSVQRVASVISAIAAELEEEPGALICMTSVGRSHVAPVLGSIAEGVLQETFGPLLLVGPHVQEQRFAIGGAMVVCTDGSDTAEAILPVAAQWAIAIPFEPLVINVVDPTGAQIEDDAEEDLDVICARNAAHELQRAIGRAVQYEVLHGNQPARAIAEYADDNSASLIAMATHGTSGVRRVVLGSVAMSVIHHATCPVLVDRPPHLPFDK